MERGDYQVIVVGVGGMGSAACHELAKRGISVLGVEQFSLGHDRGSSHGQTRVIRKAYFEDPRYVPLLHRTYELWRALEAAAGERLMQMAGCLNVGPPDHVAIQGVRRSVDMHRLAHEVLDVEEIRQRWPALNCSAGDIGVYEEEAGVLFPERCIEAHVMAARKLGAAIRENQPVLSWRANGDGVTVRTGDTDLHGHYLIIAGGAWLPKVAADLMLPLRVERQVQAWFAPVRPELFTVGRMPVFIHFVEDRAVKVARHHGGATVTADSVDRAVNAGDEADIRWYLRRYVPEANGPMVAAKVCLYTNTPDEHFIIDRHPRFPNVLIAGGFSGHGFKFAPVVGEILADLIASGRTAHDIGLYSIARLVAGG